MKYTATFLEADYESLKHHLTSRPGVEQAAYLICRPVRTPAETRLLVREVIPVEDERILSASAVHMSIDSTSFTRAMKRADDARSCLLFVHSHPSGYPTHSPQDDAEERKFFRSAYIRIRTAGVHGSLVFCDGDISAARVWLETGEVAPIERIRIIGDRFRFLFPSSPADAAPPPFFDRQIRAFGPEIQRVLGKLTVGVVGAGGTGSCVSEQLLRLGVGHLVTADGDVFDPSNVNRVYSSRVVDAGLPKVKLIERLAADIGLGTKITVIPKSITFRDAIEQLRECDILFGCTDDEWGRSLLTKFAVYYSIPVFDMGVKIDSDEGIISAIQGRVTTLLPGVACLNCRGRLSAERIRAESLWALDPDGAKELEREGYIPKLGTRAPAIVPFTSMVASSAVAELLHRLTGYLGADRQSSEVIHLFDDTRLRTNSAAPRPECFCGDRNRWNRGDAEPLLDLVWRADRP